MRPGHAPWRLEDIRGRRRVVHEADLADVDAVRARRRGACGPTGSFTSRPTAPIRGRRDVDAMVATNVLGTMHLVRACCARRLRGVRQHRLVVGVRVQGPRAGRDRVARPEQPLRRHQGGGDALLPPHGAAASDAADRDAAALLGLRPVGGAEPAHADAGRARPRAATLPPLVDPDTARDFVYVDDVCDAFVRAATRAGARSRAPSTTSAPACRRSLGDVVATARRMLGVAQEPRWGAMRDRGVGHERLGGRSARGAGCARLGASHVVRRRLRAHRRVVPAAARHDRALPGAADGLTCGAAGFTWPSPAPCSSSRWSSACTSSAGSSWETTRSSSRPSSASTATVHLGGPAARPLRRLGPERRRAQAVRRLGEHALPADVDRVGSHPGGRPTRCSSRAATAWARRAGGLVRRHGAVRDPPRRGTLERPVPRARRRARLPGAAALHRPAAAAGRAPRALLLVRAST